MAIKFSAVGRRNAKVIKIFIFVMYQTTSGIDRIAQHIDHRDHYVYAPLYNIISHG